MKKKTLVNQQNIQSKPTKDEQTQGQPHTSNTKLQLRKALVTHTHIRAGNY
jgi:hypothetical protein